MRTPGSLSCLSRIAVLACMLACLAPSQQTRAAQSARSIVPQLQEQFGLSETQVSHALGVLLVFARERLPKPEFDALAQRLPNADLAMQAVKMQGVVTGPLDDRGEYEEVLSSIGLAQPSQFGPAVLAYLAAAGYNRERDILAGVLN